MNKHTARKPFYSELHTRVRAYREAVFATNLWSIDHQPHELDAPGFLAARTNERYHRTLLLEEVLRLAATPGLLAAAGDTELELAEMMRLRLAANHIAGQQTEEEAR